jgi:hypothetical protein
MKKLIYVVAFGGLVLASCQKEKAKTSQATADNKGNPYKKMDGAGKPLRYYMQGNDDCYDDESENCAPDDIVIQDYPPNHWLVDFLDWLTEDASEYSAESVDVRWSSPVPSEPIFRTHEYDNLLLAGFSNLGIKTQAQLNGLDNETFYKILFPTLPDEQRAMLYSRSHNTLIGRNKNGKGFIFIVPKDKTTLQEAYANLIFVIPFTLSK